VSTVIWRFSDGKAGHDRQSIGLVNALADRVAVASYEIPVASGYSAFRCWLTGRYRPGDGLPSPHLLIGAGHATHLHLLAARRSHGGRSVVLMTPTLPCAWFDLCMVPQHDGVAPAPNVVTTRGVLTDVRWSNAHDSDIGLIVIGGPSRHFRWDNARIIEQVEHLRRQRPKARWWLTTSRRTPAELVDRLCQQTGLVCLPASETSSDWLPARLAEAGEAWVTRDSVSMIYEALSSGARVGLLDVVARGRNRVSAAIDRLVDDGWVTAPGQWEVMAPGPELPLSEAARCADWIVQQWLNVN
jgi:mitochondrial fission protein ELM1